MITELVAIVFWLSAGIVTYVYVGYPLILTLLARLGWNCPVHQDSIQPSVTLIISAFNEVEVIEAKIRNSLALDYPVNRIEILVVSDASTDGTDEIVRNFSTPRLQLLRMPDRSGKTAGLNQAVAKASGQIVVFSDANAMYDSTAIHYLTRNFADPEVGAVTGESRYSVDDHEGSARSENRYWQYELTIKRLESRLGSLVGGDGAIYALRKELYKELDPADLSDFVNPLQVVAQGYRNVFEEKAFSVERAASGFDAEFARKVRIVNRGWRAMWKMRGLLNPRHSGFFSVQFISHKLLRWLVGPLLGIAFLANLMIVDRAPVYVLTLGAQCILYGAALLGHLAQRFGSKPPRWLEIPYYFCIVNLASMAGIFQALIGKKYTTWTTSRAGS